MPKLQPGVVAEWLKNQTDAIETNILKIKPLYGGASMETWLISADFNGGSFDGIIDLILRTDPDAALPQSIGALREFQVLQIVNSENIITPKPLFVDSEGILCGKPAFFMTSISGNPAVQTDNILFKDPKSIPTSFTKTIGRQLARIHNIDPAKTLINLLHSRGQQPRIEYFWEQLDQIPFSLPTIEWAIRWLNMNLSETNAPTLCHGDFRSSNIMRDNQTLTGIIDWEFAHYGNPLEDLGWFCARCWRYGNDTKRAGGVGELKDLMAGYEEEAHNTIDWSLLPYWEVNATVHWSIIAHQQGLRYCNDSKKSLELVLTGEKAAEIEYDLLEQIRNFKG
ncbi:MAG: phosphotransferase family protein [Rhodospirillaceae bacterium]|nr:phosphotransferase family protein [Rhodospirillaceae bacterium]